MNKEQTLEFLSKAADLHASDIFIIAGRPLSIKTDGRLSTYGDRLMPEQTSEILEAIYQMANNRDISRLHNTGDDDFSFSIPGLSRFRINAYKQRGSLAKGSTQGSNIIFCISAYLTLAYDTTIVSMQVFQRIFQRNDMPFARMVDSIYKAGHGCGFSASGRSGYKNHAFCQISNTHDILGNRKLGGIRQLESDNTYDCCQRTTLFVSIDTKT